MDQTHQSFASAVGLPASLDDIDEHLTSLETSVRSSQWSDAQRAMLLLEGRIGVRLSPIDFAAIGDRPPLPDDRSLAGLTVHLERLIMPDVHADARADYADWLALDEPDKLAESLEGLDRGAPDVVTALLELDIARASQLLGPSKQWDTYIRDVVIAMAKIRTAFVLRLIAEEVGDRLHSPFGWEQLDGPADENTPRLGQPERKLRKDLALVEHALALYRKGRGDPVALSDTNPSARKAAQPTAKAARPNRPASNKKTKLLLSGAEKVRAEKWLEELRARHGNGLEKVLESKITLIEGQIERLRQRLDAHVNVHSRKKRAGNRDCVPPLMRLMIAVRSAVAWTQLPPQDDTAKKRHDKVKPAKPTGIEVALGWMQHGKGPCPPPTPHKDHTSIVIKVFTILRFVFVDDDDMLPTELRSVTNPETGRPKNVKSQADAKRVMGRRYSFDELFTAHGNVGKKARTEVARLLEKARSRNSPKRQPAILGTMLQRFAEGFMTRSLP